MTPEPKPEKTREQELADRVKSLKRLRSQEATQKGQIDKLDLQCHRDMLQEVLSRTREECDELRAQVAREKAPSDNGEAIPPTQCDSQHGNDMSSQTASQEMYLSTVEEESGDESMLMGTSTGAENDLDVSRDNGIWERRRNAIIKNKRMVKRKDKDKLKVKGCKTIIIEEEPPPALPASGKHLAEVVARLSPEEISVVLGHLPSSTAQDWVQSFDLLKFVGSVSSRVFFKTLKSKVSARSSFVSGPIWNGSRNAPL